MNSSSTAGRSDLRERILENSTRLFADEGFSATSMRELADASGCGKPALYYYFGSKDGLYREVVRRQLDAFESLTAQWVNSPEPVRESTHRVVDNLLDFAEQHVDAMRLLQRIDIKPEEGAPAFNIPATRQLHLDLLAGLMQRAAAAGQIRNDIDPVDGALAVAGAISFQCELGVGRAHWDRQRLHRTIDLIFDGISP